MATVCGALYFNGAPAYRTAVGEQRTTRLEDGSILYLNTDSRVQIDYSSTERLVRLVRGEALFVVAPDPERPFRVRSDDTLIQALGTQFNVNRQVARTTVAVLEGRVRVQSEIVSAGEVNRYGSRRFRVEGDVARQRRIAGSFGAYTAR